MRLSDSLSESLLSESLSLICLRLAGGFALVTSGFALVTGASGWASSSLESNDGRLMAAVLEAVLGLVRASMIDGCFASVGERGEGERSTMEQQLLRNSM